MGGAYVLSTLLIISLIRNACSLENPALARVESCRGCQLNRLPEVKKFIFEDVPNYKNVEFKPISGAPPELVLIDQNNEEIKRLSLSQYSRIQLNDLLDSYGFVKKDNNREL